MDTRKALELVVDKLHNGPNSLFNFTRLEGQWLLRVRKTDVKVKLRSLAGTKLLHVCQPEKAYEMLSTNKSVAPFMGTVSEDGLCYRCRKEASDKVMTRWKIISKLQKVNT